MDISGRWYNELNSTMDLEVKGKKKIRGTYVSAVGEVKGPYELVGFTDGGASPTVGWIVAWQNEQKSVPAVTGWTGQAQIVNRDGKDEEQIDTMWTLIRSTAVQDDWESTMIGKDTFRRHPFSDQEVRRAMKVRGVRSVRPPERVSLKK